MNIRETVEQFKGCSPLAGVDDAWQWSPAPGLHFSGILSADRTRLFHFVYADSADEAIVPEVLIFAREHSAELTADRPLSAVAGLSCSERDFDTLASLPPSIHRQYQYELPEFTPFVVVVFPGYRCEFAGDESEPETLARRRLINPSVLDREPSPFLKMRYDNTRTLSRSKGKDRGIAAINVLLRELPLLEDAPGSFVEFENRHREVWHVTWQPDRGWLVAEGTGGGESREITLDALRTFAHEQLHR
jgi:hypothetical protein